MSCILFNYRNKIDVSIHDSLISNIVLALIRVVSLVLISIRYFVYLDGNSNIASYEIIYLTFYGFLISWIYFGSVVIHFIVDKLIFRNKNRTQVGIFIEDCVNVLYEVALAIQMTLTLLFWTLLAGDGEGQSLGGFDNLGIHLMPFLLLVLDFGFNTFQFPLRHFVFTTITAGIYIVINQVHACSVGPVYSIYECGNVWIPGVAFIILALAHAIGHLNWKYFRGKQIVKKLSNNKTQSLLVDQI